MSNEKKPWLFLGYTGDYLYYPDMWGLYFFPYKIPINQPVIPGKSPSFSFFFGGQIYGMILRQRPGADQCM